MSLESATYINDLVTTNPVAGDDVAQGDDHLRLIKAVLKATFPGATGPLTFPVLAVTSKSANFSITSAERTATFLVTTTSGAVVATLPSLVAGDAGWECSFIKVTTDTNPLFIAPPSGTIQSGEYASLARTRRCIPGRRTRVLWTGTAWIAERVINNPIGSFIDHALSALPVGYEYAYGQTLASASTNYPEYYAANGSSGVVLDLRGRVLAGKDDMGGSSANRLTAAVTGGINGDTLAAAGGVESHVLTAAQLPASPPTGTIASTVTSITGAIKDSFVGGGSTKAIVPLAEQSGSQTDATWRTASVLASVFTGANLGSGAAHNILQPTIVTNKLLVVE